MGREYIKAQKNRPASSRAGRQFKSENPINRSV
jgi:hypothetical protein